MRKLQITRLDPQIAVCDTELGIRTSIDVMGRDQKNRPVVIELKTTQDSKDQHRQRYYTRCRNCPTLSNGLPNTEFWRHQLQCGFGMLCKNTSQGIVVVVCSDGVVHYPVSSTACDRRMFKRSSSAATVKVPERADCKTIEWPTGADQSLRAALTKIGFGTVTSTNPIVVEGQKLGLAAAIIVHKAPSYKGSRLASNHRLTVRALAKRVYAKQKKPRPKTRALIVSLQRGKWCIEKVGAILK